MDEQSLNLINMNDYEFNKIIDARNLGRTYLFSLEIDNEFPFDMVHLTAFCRKIQFSNKGKSLELKFLLSKELWEAFENLKENSNIKINALRRDGNILLSQTYKLPTDINNKNMSLCAFEHSNTEQSDTTFNVYFELQ
jgi:hypothetical protein